MEVVPQLVVVIDPPVHQVPEPQPPVRHRAVALLSTKEANSPQAEDGLLKEAAGNKSSIAGPVSSMLYLE